MNKSEVLRFFGYVEGQRGGGLKALAELLDISQPAIIHWGDKIPRERAMYLHEVFHTHEHREEKKALIKKYGKGFPKYDPKEYRANAK